MADLIRYKLDDLGWYQFEALVQSLLKAAAGLAVESWGGSSDLGCDAYSEHDVSLSTVVLTGPVVFQVKFVSAANAAGARSSAALKKAVTAEMRLRQKVPGRTPQSYVLITNAPLSGPMHSQIRELISAAFPRSMILLWGNKDLCDMLDSQPELRKAFPELLSLRDLDLFLADVVNRDVLERSRAAIEETRDLVPVFVPTSAYARAWDVLERYSFVVLDGAPEMGKTAIARAIGLAHIFSGWQMIDCQEPTDFFRLYSEGDQQVFIADDAFGRTEYDPSLGRGWERSLPKVLQRLNSTHRLVLTTRKHVLQRGLRDMDLVGKAEHFPDPAEVIVTATDLTIEERSRMLYRHARAASVEATGRAVVRKHAAAIVQNPDFTPERIRRAMADLSSKSGHIPDRVLEANLMEAIRSPTERARITFQKLGTARQWLLIAFLECDRRRGDEELERRFRVLYSEVLEEPFAVILDDLVGTFLRQTNSLTPNGQSATLAWIHPSYRDLVISELARSEQQRWRFFSLMNEVGASMALTADAGRNQRVLTAAKGDLELVLARSVAIVENDVETAASILASLKSFVGDEPNSHEEVAAAAMKMAATCTAAIALKEWSPPAYELSQIFEALASFGVTVPVLDVSLVWGYVCELIESSCKHGLVPEEEELEQWLDWRALIMEYYPRYYERIDYRDRADRIEGLLVGVAETEIQPPWYWDGDPSEEKAQRLGALADCLQMVRDGHAGLVARLRTMADMYSPRPNDGPKSNTDMRPQVTRTDFDVVRFFADL